METERQIAEKMIADAESMAKEGKAKLAELDKPKQELNHLDYGDRGHDKWIKIFDEIHWIDRYKQVVSTLPETCFVESIQGNLKTVFDDLKARSEPLKELKVIEGEFEFRGIKQAKQCHQDLGCLIAKIEAKK